VESHILHDLLLLVDLALGDGDVLLGLQVVLSGIGVAPADSLDGTTGCLDVDDVSDGNLLLLNVLVDRGV